MGLMQRRKGRKAESECKKLLTSRDWMVIDTASGLACEDLVATSDQGKTYCVEVKNHKVLKVEEFLKQAREQAKKRKLPWMLCCRLPQFSETWLVFRQDEPPCVWRGL